MKKINDVKRYVYQKDEIDDGENYCGSACVAMITGDDPQHVADQIGLSAQDTLLTDYLTEKEFSVEKITDGGTQKTSWGFVPTVGNYDSIKKAIDENKVVLYHIAGWDKKSSGHYIICVGYDDLNFIFCDPAGDRAKGYFNSNGNIATYTRKMLDAAGMKRCFSVWMA